MHSSPDPGPPMVRVPHTVTLAEVDLVQINFISYFGWMEDGFTALMKLLGHPFSEIFASGHAAPIVDATCSYLEPVALDQIVEGISGVAKVGRSSFVVRHRFERDGRAVAEGRVTHVWARLGPPVRAISAPEWIRAAEARATAVVTVEPTTHPLPPT